MPSEDKLNINIEVCGRRFQMSIPPDQEESLRAAVSDVGKKVEYYQKRLPRKDLIDIISLVAVDYSIRLWKEQNNRNDSLIEAEIERINDEIDSILSED